MRILFVVNLYPPHDLGGMEQVCYEMVTRLQGRGHHCYVLTNRPGTSAPVPAEANVERSLYLDADLKHYKPADFFLHRRKRLEENLLHLRQAITNFRPDLISIWSTWLLPHDLIYRAEQWLPGRVALSVADYMLITPNAHEAYWGTKPKRPLVRALSAPIRRYALQKLRRERESRKLELRHVTICSTYTFERLLDAGALPHGATVILNGIDAEPFRSRPNARGGSPLRLVYTGGLASHKGVLTAIQAMGILRASREDTGVSLLIVGGGHPEYVQTLQREVDRMDLTNQVRFRGQVPRDEIASILAEHDVFLFTSIYEEPFGRTSLEAMAAGLAVVSTNVGGQREFVMEGTNALVYPPGDAEQLASCILRLRDDLPLRQRLADAGRRTVEERFTLERMVDEMEEWLQGIAG